MIFFKYNKFWDFFFKNDIILFIFLNKREGEKFLLKEVIILDVI